MTTPTLADFHTKARVWRLDALHLSQWEVAKRSRIPCFAASRSDVQSEAIYQSEIGVAECSTRPYLEDKNYFRRSEEALLSDRCFSCSHEKRQAAGAKKTKKRAPYMTFWNCVFVERAGKT